MKELINFAEWLHDNYVCWGEREGNRAYLPYHEKTMSEGTETCEEVVSKYYLHLIEKVENK